MEHERHAGLHPVGSAAFFEAIVNTAVSPFVVIDRDLILRFVSESATALLGWKPDEWVGRSIAGLLTEDSLEVAAAGLGDLNELPEDPEWVGAPVRVYVKRSDGTTIPIDAAARAEERTGISGIVVQLHRAGGSQAMSDAVDAILDGNDLDRALTLLTSLIEHEISDTSAVLANEWDGRCFAQASGANTLMKLDWPLPADRAAIQHALDSGHAVRDIFERLDPATQAAAHNAGLHGCWCAPIPATDRDDPTAALFVWHAEPGPPGAIYRTDIARSVSLARLALRWMGQQRLLAWDAAHDHLTGLANRSELQNRLDEGNGRARAILYLDLDDFKPVNDHFGHRVGDEVLAAVAGRLQSIGGSHLVARLGGDEFAVLVNPLDDPDEPVHLAEQARLALAKPISVLGQLATVGVCVGVAIDPTGAADGDHLLDQADRLLREGKNLGKNQVRSVVLPPRS